MIHSSEFLEIVNDAKSRIREVTVAVAIERIKSGAVLIDVREDSEFETAHAHGAKHMGRGYRSALAADMIQKMGYTNVWSMAGGWAAWQEAEAPIVIGNGN